MMFVSVADGSWVFTAKFSVMSVQYCNFSAETYLVCKTNYTYIPSDKTI